MDQTNMQPENLSSPGTAEVGKLFRSAMHGFNRQDVTEYIERMARDRRRDAERYGAHIRTLEEERAETAGELEKLRGQAAELIKNACEAADAKEAAEKELAALTAELEALRGEKNALEQEKESLAAALSEKAESGTADLRDELETAKQAAQEKDGELERLRAALDAAKRENERLLRDAETARGRSGVSGGAAALISKVRAHGVSSQNTDSGAMQQRIDRARQCVQEGISECTALYHEMHRNIERLEEILRNLDD